MTYASDYTPTNSFADDETTEASGRSTVRTVELDNQFADISAAHNELNANVKKIQRDDDKLRDFIVEPYTLSEQTRAMLAAAGKTIRGEWLPFVNYYVGDLVQRSTIAYLCQTAHNSGPAWNLGFWIAISGDGQAHAWAEAAQVSQIAAAASEAMAAGSASTASVAATSALASAAAAAGSALAAQNSADSIAGLSPVNLPAYMLDFLTNTGAAGARADLGAPAASDLGNAGDIAKGAGMLGLGALGYGVDTVGGALFTTLWGDGVTDRSALLASANALGRPIRIVGSLHVPSPTTITVPLVDGTAQIFTAASQVTLDNGLPVRPEWFGPTASPYRAARALPAKGGVVALRSRTYPACGFSYGGDYMDRDNVVFRGEQMPVLATDCRKLENGTIINGAFIVYANNVTIENLGIDSGATYLGAGAGQEAMFCSYGSPALRAASSLRKGLKLHNVIGLCKDPAVLTHSMLVGEGYTDVTLTGDIAGVYGVHAIVIKCNNVRGGAALTGLLNDSDSIIFKTDGNVTDASFDVAVGDMRAFNDGAPGLAPYVLPTAPNSIGVFFHAFAGNLSKIKTGHINERGHAYGVKAQMDGAYIIDGLHISSITTDLNSIAGQVWGTGFGGASFQRCTIGPSVNRNAPTGFINQVSADSDIKFGPMTAVNCSVAGAAVAGVASPLIESFTAENCAFVYQFSTTRRPRIGATILKGTTVWANLYNPTGATVPTLAANWSQIPAGEPWRLKPVNYGFELVGTLTPGVGATPLVVNLPAWALPDSPRYRCNLGKSGVPEIGVPITVNNATGVYVNKDSASLANVSDWVWLGVTWTD